MIFRFNGLGKWGGRKIREVGGNITLNFRVSKKTNHLIVKNIHLKATPYCLIFDDEDVIVHLQVIYD
jgi:hypothetical protein